jgi:hypothetical protein
VLGAGATWYALRSPDSGDTESLAPTPPGDGSGAGPGDGPVALAAESGAAERSATGVQPAASAESDGATEPRAEPASGGAAAQSTEGAEPADGSAGEGATDTATLPTESATTAAARESGGADVEDSDDGATRPRGPDLGSSDPDPQTDDGGTPPPDPAGVIRFGPLVTPKNPGPTGSHSEARKYCEGLASIRHLGIGAWKLATPSTAAKLVGNKQIKRTSYWTSARWKGKVLVVKLPSGSKSSVKAERSAARPLCVAKWP